MTFSRVPGPDELYVGSIFNLRSPQAFKEKNITHVLSVIKYSFEGWGEEAKKFDHICIDVDDVEESDLLAYFSSAVRFIDRGLHPPGVPAASKDVVDETVAPTSQGAVLVHCAMGKSRSVACVIAYLLYKYPHRFGGKPSSSSAAAKARRRETAGNAVYQALKLVREGRPGAEPNPGFMKQLELWWEMDCPADDDSAVENHPIYQKWLYARKLKEATDLGMAPEAAWIRFEDEAKPTPGQDRAADGGENSAGGEIRCKKCRRMLTNARFIIEHRGTGIGEQSRPPCPHVFVETLSWMRPYLETGELDGRLLCPNTKCGAIVGRFAWQGFKCSCGEWVCPAFSLNRSRVDEVDARRAFGIRMPPGRNGSL